MLRRPGTRSKLVAECHAALQRPTDKYTVTTKWTNSQSPCLGTDRADSLARGKKLTLSQLKLTSACQKEAEI